MAVLKNPRNPLWKLWQLVQGDPVFMRRVNGYFTFFWLLMIPVSLAMGWLSSVVYVSALSLWALVSGHWSAWQAARVETTEAEREERGRRADIKQRPGVSRSMRVRSSRIAGMGRIRPS